MTQTARRNGASNFIPAALAVIFAMMLVFIAPVGAHAADEDGAEVAPTGPASTEALLAELEQSGIPEAAGPAGERIFSIPGTPEIPGGLQFVFPQTDEGDADAGSGVSPMIGGGFTSNGWYVLLNATDQRVLLTAGTGALVVGICAIPAVGQVACGLIGVGLGGATSYLTANPICQGNLRIEFAGSLGGATFLPPRCV